LPDAGWAAIDLGLAGGQATEATSINDAGTIVGSVWHFGDGSFSIGGFVYKSGVMRTLQGLAGVYELEPAAINASEKIVGTAQDTNNGSILVVWDTPDVGPKLLGGTHRVGMAALNDRGDIAVTDELDPGISYNALVWRNGVSLNLGNLTDTSVDNPSTQANAMNSSGQIVGTSQVAAVRYANASPDKLMHPFLWENGVMRDLGTLAPYPCTNYGALSPADCSAGWAAGINAHGVVVGSVTGSEGKLRAFIWKDGTMTGLSVYSGQDTRGRAINDRGQVLATVGSSVFLWENGQAQVVVTDATTVYWGSPLLLGPNGEVVGSMWVGGEQHAFVWESGKLTDLGPGQANAINNRLEIVGYTLGPQPTPWSRAKLWRRKP
jgi:probable HAF family extracellular repeat protein